VETGSRSACQAVLQCLVDEGVTSLGTALPSLDDVYLHVVGDRGLLL
jgi:ABC-2 type transport system ATP-binding protein